MIFTEKSRPEMSLKGVQDLGAGTGISVSLFTSAEPLTFPCGVYLAEDLCFQVARHCDIGPSARHLFGLRHLDNGVPVGWLWPCQQITVGAEGQRLQLEFRLRFHVCQIERLHLSDSNALNYYFHQLRTEFIKGLITEPLRSKEKTLGLAVIDMLRVIKENKIPREAVEREFRKYLPRDLSKKFYILPFIRSALHESLVNVEHNIRDVGLIKSKYIQQLNELSQQHIVEEFVAQVDDQGQVMEVFLQVDPFHSSEPGLRIRPMNKRRDWKNVCSIEELCFISMRTDGTVEISRKNGIPQYYKFGNTTDMYTFISLLDGYYRLMEKWNFNLCKDLMSPCLVKLRSMKCHGPVGRDFALRKLQEKCKCKPGCYILRQDCMNKEYAIDVCVGGMDQPQVLPIGYDGEMFHFQNSSDKCKTMQELIADYNRRNGGILRECIPPSEYDVSPLLLCRISNDTDGSSSENRNENFSPCCINSQDLKIDHQVEYAGRMMTVHKGIWRKSSSNNIVVVVKTLNRQLQNNPDQIKDFLEAASHCLFWHCETIVTMYGMVLANPLALVTEFLPYGSLDVYLRNNRKKVQEVDLVEAATYLGKALWYLEEKGVVHGNLRCRNVFVVSHDTTSFKVKLAEPGIPQYTDDQIHWIPPECHHNLTKSRKLFVADVWAFGTTLWEIFSYGELPLPNDSVTDVKALYRRGGRLSHPNNCHCDVYKLMTECWAKDPDARKKPQAIVRDINQILYEVHNSRRVHAYATLLSNGNSTLGTCDSQSNLSRVQTAQVGSSTAGESLDTGITDVSGTDASASGSAMQLGRFGTLEPSPSNTSLEHMDYPAEVDGGWVIETSQLEILGKLGQGFYGEVCRARWLRWAGLGEEDVAVKQLKLSCESNDGYDDLLREISIMKSLRHPNIVEIKGVVEEPKTLLVMEFVPMGSMLVYVRTQKHRLNEKQLLKFALDIANGMEYLGTKRIVHRDLAARNILVASEDTVKISDFGLAQVMGEKSYYKLRTNRHLPLKWYSPETIRNWKFTTKSDVWSFGITLWEMFSGGEEPVIEGCKDDELLTKLESGRRLGCPPTCGVQIYNRLMRRCWQVEEASRPTFLELLPDIKELYEEAHY